MSQNSIALRSLLSWIEKISVNANTTELDTLELNGLRTTLETLMNTKQTVTRTITVPSTGLVLTDLNQGNLTLNVPVTLDEEDAFVIPTITKDESLVGILNLIVKFIPDETVTTFTVNDALTLFQSIQESILEDTLVPNKLSSDIITSVQSIGTLDWGSDNAFIWNIDFTSLNYFINFISSSETLGLTPTLTIDPTEVNFGEVVTGQSDTETINVSGVQLPGDVLIAVIDKDLFSVDVNFVSKEDAEGETGGDVVITYVAGTPGVVHGSILFISGGLVKLLSVTATSIAE